MSQFTHRLPHAGWTKPSRNEEEYFRRESFRSRMDLALTQPEAPSGHLTSLLRGVILEYTTGEIRLRTPRETA